MGCRFESYLRSLGFYSENEGIDLSSALKDFGTVVVIILLFLIFGGENKNTRFLS
ncbi:MAG: hypothetical protein AAB928_00390 [Patescibacteria group bacterium]